jgi:PAS domain S-box-containing protein
LGIRKKTFLFVGLIVMALVVVLATISYFVVTGRFARLENKEERDHVHQVQNEIKATIAFLDATAGDWAPWDDTYRFIQDADPAYVSNNLVDSTFTNLRLNFMLFFNNHAELAYGRCFKLNPTQSVDKAAILKAIRKQADPSLLSFSNEHSHVSGILMVRSQPYLVSAHPIVTSNFSGPIRGSLILGRRLDETEIKRIRGITKSNLTLHALDEPGMKPPEKEIFSTLERTGGDYAAPVSKNTIAGYGILYNLSGAPAMIVKVTRDRDIYRYGLSTWGQNAVATGLFGLFFIVLLMVLLNRVILNRLKDLAGRVNALAGNANCAQRLDVRSRDEIGQLAGSINTMLDSLERSHVRQMQSEKQYQVMLQANERYLRQLFDSINCGIMVVDVETRRVVDVNATGEALFQRPRQDILGQICHRLVCPNEKGNCPVLDQDQTIDLSPRTLVKADGSLLPVLKSVVRNERDGRAYLIESFTDISDLKRTEADLRHARARYRRFFDEDITGDALTAPDGRIIDCNRALAEILGYDNVEALRSLNIKPYYQRESDRRQLLERLQEEKKLERIELDLKHRDGHPVYCIGNLIGQFDEAGNLREIISYLFDDTKRVQLESDLRQAQKLEAIGTMAGGIAHDFNNILAGIMGYAELALYELKHSGPLAEKLNKILTATHRAKELVQQILAFSRQSESDPRPLQLTPIIKEVLKLVRASLPTTIGIRRQLLTPGTVIADPVQIHQVMMNLCTNAGHAMKQRGGMLTVSLTEMMLDNTFTDRHPGMNPGKYVCIGVADTGEGISPEVINRIFDPFFTTKSKNEGTGLGLSVVHGIVSKLRGAVTTTSSCAGSRFDVYLPCAEETPEHPRLETPPLPRGNEAIVFVDDEELQVEVGTRMLESLGYRVTGFTDSMKALTHITEHTDSIDLVITDMTMPHLTGLSLAGKLLNLLPSLPIIICTGFSEAITPEIAADAGIRAFLSKPIALIDLARKVREILDAGTPANHAAKRE